MGLLFKKYKTKFRYALKPIFAMLVAKQNHMPVEEWEQYVLKTEEGIKKNPIDFLGTDLPEEGLTRDILREIFTEFFKDIRIKKRNL